MEDNALLIKNKMSLRGIYRCRLCFLIFKILIIQFKQISVKSVSPIR